MKKLNYLSASFSLNDIKVDISFDVRGIEVPDDFDPKFNASFNTSKEFKFHEIKTGMEVQGSEFKVLTK